MPWHAQVFWGIFAISSLSGLAGCADLQGPAVGDRRNPRRAAGDAPTHAPQGNRWPPAWRAKEQAVEAELHALGEHDWAGSYRTHPLGLDSVTLRLAPNAGFCCYGSGCFGVYDFEEGEVAVAADGSLQMAGGRRRGDSMLHDGYVPARVGPRRYLLPVSEMADFSSRLNKARESQAIIPIGGLLRLGDEELPSDGPLLLPPAWRVYVDGPPLEVEITAVEVGEVRPEAFWRGSRTSRITLSRGSAAGVFAGMVLGTVNPVGCRLVFHVTTAGSDSANAEVVQEGRVDVFPPPPQKGWKLSTRAARW